MLFASRMGNVASKTGDSNKDCERSSLVWFSRNFFSNIILWRKKCEFILYNCFVIFLI